MVEVLKYLENIKPKLYSSLNFENVFLLNEKLFLKYPDLFYFTALNISYNKENQLKETTECIELIIKNKDRFECPSHLYFNIMYNFISHVNQNLVYCPYYSELDYHYLKKFFAILPSIFYPNQNDKYLEKCIKLIKLIPDLLSINKNEFKEPFNDYYTLINKSIETINEKTNNKSKINVYNDKIFIEKKRLNPKKDNYTITNLEVKKYIKKRVAPPKMNPQSKKEKEDSSISIIQKREDDSQLDSIQVIIDEIIDEKQKIKRDLTKSIINEVAQIFYNKMSIDTLKIECFNDDDYFLELIGSYSLSTLKNKESSIDFVFMKKDLNNINFISKSVIMEWINSKNLPNFSLIESDENQNKKGKILYYQLYNFDGNYNGNFIKNVNIYLFCNKYIECNNIFKKIFKDIKNFGILYSFFYLPLINLGLEIGSDICFLIIAFLDIEYKIFYTKENQKITKYCYEYKEKDKQILKSTYYYYQLNEQELKQTGNKNIGNLINEFNEFLIKIINRAIEIPDRLYDKKYLFRITFFNDLLSSKSIEDTTFQKIEKEIDSSFTYKELCEKIGIKYEFED